MHIRDLFNIFLVSVLKLYVAFMWTLFMCYEIWTKKRNQWIRLGDLHVVYEGSGLMVVEKHPDLLINHERPWLYCLTLQMQLFFSRPFRINWKLKNMFHFVHRLDYATSGLICVAYDRQAAGTLGRSFNRKMVGKQYLAILWGHVAVDTVTYNPTYFSAIQPGVYHIQCQLGEAEYTWESGRKQLLTVKADYPNCQNLRDSYTLAVVLEHGRLLGLPATRLLLIPQTGRRHQLRVHCSLILGHAIAGDMIYTPLSPAKDRLIFQAANNQLHRMMLHAYNLKFDLTNDKRSMLKDSDFSSSRVSMSKPGILNLYSTSKFFSSNTFWTIEKKFYSLDQWQNIYSISDLTNN